MKRLTAAVALVVVLTASTASAHLFRSRAFNRGFRAGARAARFHAPSVRFVLPAQPYYAPPAAGFYYVPPPRLQFYYGF